MGAEFIHYGQVGLRVVDDDSDSDVEFINDALNSAEMRPYLGRMRPLTVEEERERISEQRDNRGLYLLITVNGDRVGTVSLIPQWEQQNNYELTIWLIPEARGKGYGTEATKAVVNHAFEYLDCQRISAHHWEDNELSQSLLESVGFLLEGEKRSGWRWEGEYKNNLYYGLTREDWDEQQPVFREGESRADAEEDDGHEAEINISRRYNKFMYPTYEQAIRDVSDDVTTGEPTVLDAPCGPGGLLPELTSEFGPDATVHAVEKECEKILAAQDHVDKHCEFPVTFHQADLLADDLGFETGQFDCIWVADGFSPGLMSGPKLVDSLSPFLSDDGVFAMYYGNWLRPQLLPGYTDLEHRLNVVAERYYQSTVNSSDDGMQREWADSDSYHPDISPERARSWLLDAGFDTVTLDTYTVTHSRTEDGSFETRGDTDSTVDDEEIRDRLRDIYQTEYLKAAEAYLSDSELRARPSEQLVTSSDLDDLKRVFDPDSDDYLPDQSGYFCTVTALLVTAK
ncbi:GNAT family N-acetyltransferase [Natribaculum luteum]|uniref:GNAT family N-acetyltransferase n=1 Tax=Natribaculum luteum TaxID=1586232 RepID=A0ABD5P0I6_9EURY|nr:GNAT family N-acetyltransferase [Natribaculum luteum]